MLTERVVQEGRNPAFPGLRPSPPSYSGHCP